MPCTPTGTSGPAPPGRAPTDEVADVAHLAHGDDAATGRAEVDPHLGADGLRGRGLDEEAARGDVPGNAVHLAALALDPDGEDLVEPRGGASLGVAGDLGRLGSPEHVASPVRARG
jgi:hypothetical protein